MRIKELAQAVNIPVETIRYYERTGLLPVAVRTENNYRIYGKSDIERLRFIRNCRALDMNLDEIRALIQFIDQAQSQPEENADCGAVRVIVAEHLEHVRHRLKSLQLLEKQLKQLLKACEHPEPTPTTSCGMVCTLFSDMTDLDVSSGRGVHTT